MARMPEQNQRFQLPYFPGGKKKVRNPIRRDIGRKPMKHKNLTESALSNRLEAASGNNKPTQIRPIAIRKQKGDTEDRISGMRKAVAGRLGKNGGLRGQLQGLVRDRIEVLSKQQEQQAVRGVGKGGTNISKQPLGRPGRKKQAGATPIPPARAKRGGNSRGIQY